MKGLVVYDSVFGNTKKVAEEIAASLDYPLISITALTLEQLKGCEHLVVGSPTRAFRPTEPMQNFFNALAPDSLKGMKVSTFDTRVDVKKVNNGFLNFMVRLFGYAAEFLAKLLAKKGAVLLGQPAGFFVDESEGPLKEGELERASAWAKTLV